MKNLSANVEYALLVQVVLAEGVLPAEVAATLLLHSLAVRAAVLL